MHMASGQGGFLLVTAQSTVCLGVTVKNDAVRDSSEVLTRARARRLPAAEIGSCSPHEFLMTL